MNLGGLSALLGFVVIAWALWPWGTLILLPAIWWWWTRGR